MKKTTRSLPWIFFLAFIGLLSGVIASVCIFILFSPTSLTGSSFTGVPFDQQDRGSILDVSVVRHIHEQTVDVYTGAKNTRGFYNEGAFVGQGVLLTSDGLLVVHYPKERSRVFSQFEVVDFKGDVYTFEGATYDDVYELLYLDVTGTSFAVSAFIDPTLFTQTLSSWQVVRGEATSVLFDRVDLFYDPLTTYPLYASYPVLHISVPVSLNAPLFNNDGALVGFPGSDGRVVPSMIVEEDLSEALVQSSITQDMYGISGYYTAGHSTLNDKMTFVRGFYVTKSRHDVFFPHDVIVKVNGTPFDPYRFFMDIRRFTGDTFSVVVLRGGEEVEVVFVP